LLRTIKPLLVMSLTLLKILLGAVGLPPFVLPIPQGLCSSSYTAALVEHCSGQVEDAIKGMADSEDGDDPTDSFACHPGYARIVRSAHQVTQLPCSAFAPTLVLLKCLFCEDWRSLASMWLQTGARSIRV